MLAFSREPTNNEKAFFVSIRNLQVYVFKVDTDISNRGVSIRNPGLIATIGLPLPTIQSGGLVNLGWQVFLVDLGDDHVVRIHHFGYVNLRHL